MSPEILIPALTFLFQLAATGLAISNLRSSRFPVTWTLTSLALTGMTIQRGLILYKGFTQGFSFSPVNQITELTISLLALAVVLRIRPFMNKLIASRIRLTS